MTAVAERKTKLRFETADTVKGRAVMVEVSPYTAAVRLKGQRTRYEISWAGIYWQAAKVAAEKRRAERKQKRAATPDDYDRAYGPRAAFHRARRSMDR